MSWFWDTSVSFDSSESEEYVSSTPKIENIFPRSYPFILYSRHMAWNCPTMSQKHLRLDININGSVVLMDKHAGTKA